MYRNIIIDNGHEDQVIGIFHISTSLGILEISPHFLHTRVQLYSVHLLQTRHSNQALNRAISCQSTQL